MRSPAFDLGLVGRPPRNWRLTRSRGRSPPRLGTRGGGFVFLTGGRKDGCDGRGRRSAQGVEAVDEPHEISKAPRVGANQTGDGGDVRVEVLVTSRRSTQHQLVEAGDVDLQVAGQALAVSRLERRQAVQVVAQEARLVCGPLSRVSQRGAHALFLNRRMRAFTRSLLRLTTANRSSGGRSATSHTSAKASVARVGDEQQHGPAVSFVGGGFADLG